MVRILKYVLLSIILAYAPDLQGQDTLSQAVGIKSLELIKGDYRFFNAKQFSGNNNTTLVTGGFQGSLVIKSDTLISNERISGFVGLRDSLDQWLWAKNIEGDGYNIISNALELDGGWIVSGVFTDTITPGGFQLVSQAHQTQFLATLNEDGTYQWARGYELSATGGTQLISRGNDGKFFFATEFSGEFEYNDSIYSTKNIRHILLLRLSQTGSIDKAIHIHSTDDLSLALLHRSINGGVILGGNFTGMVSHKNRVLTGQGASDFFMVALSQDFQIQLLKASAGPGYKDLTGCIDHNGGYLFYGSYQGDFNFDNVDFPEAMYQNLFLFKINGNGKLLWSRHIGGDSHKAFQAFGKGLNHELYAMFNYRGTLLINGREIENKKAAYQSILVKYHHTGEPGWMFQAENVSDFLARMNNRSRNGRIEFVGISPGNPQVKVFGEAFNEPDKGLFIMELFDCDYARKIDLADTLRLCGPGFITAEDGFSKYIWNYSETGKNLRVDQSGYVVLEATDEYGCRSVDTAYVALQPVPETYIVGNTMLCNENGNILLLADGPYDFMWETGETEAVLVVDQPGVYKVTATNSFGCEAETQVEIELHPPYAPIIDEFYFVAAPDTLVINPGNYAGYSWSNGSNEPVFIMDAAFFSEGGYHYTVELHDYNGCIYSRSFSVYVVGLKTEPSTQPDVLASGSELTVHALEIIAEESEETGACTFHFFPNPGKGVINMSIYDDADLESDGSYGIQKEVVVFSAQGKVLYRHKHTTGQKNLVINLEGTLQPGNYYIALLVDGEVCSVKKAIILF